MNRLIVSIIILSVITVGCVTATVVTNGIMKGFSETVDKVEKAFVDNDEELCTRYSAQLKEDWDSFLNFGILINDLGHAVEITSCIAEIHSFAQEGNDEIYAACDRAQAQIKLFGDMQTPTIWKIL